jgi:hypothetical protein
MAEDGAGGGRSEAIAGLSSDSAFAAKTTRGAWEEAAEQLDQLLRPFFPDLVAIASPVGADLRSARALSWLLGRGAAVVVAQVQEIVKVEEATGRIRCDQQLATFWVLLDRSAGPLECTVGLAPRGDGTSVIVFPGSPEAVEEASVPLEEVFPYGLNELIAPALPNSWYPQPRPPSDDRPGDPAAVWRVPCREPHVRAQLPFTLEAAALERFVVPATTADGAPVTAGAELLCFAGDWAPVRGWPSPGFVVPASAVVYPLDAVDWERATLDWEVEPVRFLLQPLGGETLVQLYGGGLTGPVAAKAFELALRQELRAEGLWCASPLLG